MPLKIKQGRKHNQPLPAFPGWSKVFPLSMPSRVKHRAPRKEGGKYTDLVDLEGSYWKYMGIWRSRWYSELGMVSSISHLNLPSLEQFFQTHQPTHTCPITCSLPRLWAGTSVSLPFIEKTCHRNHLCSWEAQPSGITCSRICPCFSAQWGFKPLWGGHFPPSQRSIYQGEGN